MPRSFFFLEKRLCSMRFFFFFLHALLPLYQNFESQSGITIHKVSHIHSHSSFLSLFNEVSSLVYTTWVLIHILLFYSWPTTSPCPEVLTRKECQNQLASKSEFFIVPFKTVLTRLPGKNHCRCFHQGETWPNSVAMPFRSIGARPNSWALRRLFLWFAHVQSYF